MSIFFFLARRKYNFFSCHALLNDTLLVTKETGCVGRDSIDCFLIFSIFFCICLRINIESIRDKKKKERRESKKKEENENIK